MGKIRESIGAAAAIGLDMGKDVFDLVAFTADGEVAFRRKIKRLAVTDTFRALPPCVAGTALMAAVGGGEAFSRGRDFGAWLGLVPHQHKIVLAAEASPERALIGRSGTRRQ